MKEYEKFEDKAHDFKKIYKNYEKHRDFACVEYWLYEKIKWVQNILKTLLFCFKWKKGHVHEAHDKDICTGVHLLDLHSHTHDNYYDQMACDLFKADRVVRNEYGVRIVIKLNHYIKEI